MEKSLNSIEGEPVFFLTAEPGAGKTSVLSWLANRRSEQPFLGIIALRFFCFEPIRPESPFIAPDSSRVRPEELWFSLLAQLRAGLRGRLHELRVPLRDDFLTWKEARAHVIRLADQIGREHRHRLVIMIDGIDHAARAAQTMPQQTAEFFSSLPSPNELADKSLRLLVAGQPPEYFSEQYPSWLQHEDSLVRRLTLPALQNSDVGALYREARTGIPREHDGEVLRVIEQLAKGNTLSTVFAVAECEHVVSVTQLAQRLADRHLSDGLAAYYTSIWQHAVNSAGDLSSGIDTYLVGALSLARRGVKAEMLADAFEEWNRPAVWWLTILEHLGPLLTNGPHGFRVRHNDVRVFLSARFSAAHLSKQRVASRLADYYVRQHVDRSDSHLQLFDLLSLAGRLDEAARHFTVDWVVEAAALGIETSHLFSQCHIASRGLQACKDWQVVTSVACAAQTLDRLNETREESSESYLFVKSQLPPFLPSEAAVRPLVHWTIRDFEALLSDAHQLADGDEPSRAKGLLCRWLDGLSIEYLVKLFSSSRTPRLHSVRPGELDLDLASSLESLGRLSGRLAWKPRLGTLRSKSQIQACLAFERGFVDAALVGPSATYLSDLLHGYKPKYVSSWERLIRGLSNSQRWDLVREGLVALSSSRNSLSASFRAECTWWATKSEVAKQEPSWIDPLSQPDLGLDPNIALDTGKDAISPFLCAARAVGWQRLDLDAGDIADLIYLAFDPHNRFDDRKAPTQLIFRASALIGRIEAAFSKNDIESARTLVSPNQLRSVCSALWGDVVMRNSRFEHRVPAAELASEIAELSFQLGNDYDVALLDAAVPVANSFPIDFRRPAIWKVLRRHSCAHVLEEWVLHWLAPSGEVWKLSQSELHTVIHDLVAMAQDLELRELALYALERARWRPIGYRSHKEYAFEQVLEWFEEAASLSPQVWTDAGWKLWCLSNECDTQHGDNRFEWELKGAIATAAFRDGASSWWRLISSTLSNSDSRHWHEETRRWIVEGCSNAIQRGTKLRPSEIRVIWSLCLAFSYWTHERDSHSLLELKNAILSSTESLPEDVTILLCQSVRGRSLALLEESKKNDDVSRPREVTSAEPTASDSAETNLRGSQIILPSEAAAVVQQLGESTISAERDSISEVLASIGTGEEHMFSWNHIEKDVSKSLYAIGLNTRDDELWGAVIAATKSLKEEPFYSIHGFYDNLFRIALGRAKARGLAEIIAGLECQVAMHARWAYGGPSHEAIRWVQLPDCAADTDWLQIASQLFRVLLTSYSVEVLQAALEGMHSLVASEQSFIELIYAEVSTEWQRHWLLSASEAWAASYPQAMKTVRHRLENLLETGSLHEKLQAWIVLCKQADISGHARPRFPLPDAISVDSIAKRADATGLLHVPAIKMGHAQFIGSYAAARSILRNLKHCGGDFDDLEGQIASNLAPL